MSEDRSETPTPFSEETRTREEKVLCKAAEGVNNAVKEIWELNKHKVIDPELSTPDNPYYEVGGLYVDENLELEAVDSRKDEPLPDVLVADKRGITSSVGAQDILFHSSLNDGPSALTIGVLADETHEPEISELRSNLAGNDSGLVLDWNTEAYYTFNPDGAVEKIQYIPELGTEGGKQTVFQKAVPSTIKSYDEVRLIGMTLNRLQIYLNRALGKNDLRK